MRRLLFLVFLLPGFMTQAKVSEQDTLSRVVVELEYFHKMLRQSSIHGRVDAEKSFPYADLLLRVGEIRSGVLRHLNEPQTQAIEFESPESNLPIDLELTSQEKMRLRGLIIQLDSVLDMVPKDSADSTGKIRFNYKALTFDLLEIKNYLRQAVFSTGNTIPTSLPEFER